MRAIGITEFGGPDVLQVLDLPSPEPGPGEVRVRVQAATVNPTDTMMRAGAQGDRLAKISAPYIPGMDLSGHVDAIGPDTDGRLSVGDPVIGFAIPYAPTKGAYAEQVVLPAASVVRAPANVDMFAASTLLMNAMTARLALDAMAVSPGDTIAVTGAAGCFGGYAVQLAKADGLRVIADAADKDEELVRSLGADQIVARGGDVAARIRELIPDGVPGLADGAVMDALVLPAIADGGHLSVVRRWGGPSERGITIHPIGVGVAAEDTAGLERLVRQVEDGTLTLRVADVLPASQAAQAHRLLEAGGIRGRIVLDFS